MMGNQFIPKMTRLPDEAQNEVGETKADSTADFLLSISRYAVIGLIGLLPIFFTPGLWATLGFDKVIFSLTLSLIAIVCGSLIMLRKKVAKTVLPLTLGFFWLFVLAGLAAGVLSGDVQDALRGRFIENQTVGFFALLALVMSVPLFLQGSKVSTIKALVLFGGTTTLILIYNLVRLVFGSDFLSFGSFSTVTVSPFGSLNDLAILSAVLIIFGLITLIQLPIKKSSQIVVAGVMVLSLTFLAIINFFNVWLIVGFFSFLTLLYLLSRDTIFKASDSPKLKNSALVIFMTALICVVSVIFIVAGDFAGGKLSQVTNIDYIEVRPSHSSTVSIAKAVYSENILLGAGPNKFSDAWREYKSVDINQTIFWDTEFNSGSSYISTIFVNLGILGGVFIVLFSLSFIYLGYKMLLRSAQNDLYWYYLGAVSFSVAIFIWTMAYVYSPGSAVLLIGAWFTGLTFVAAGNLVPEMNKKITLAANRRLGFLLMAIIIIIIASSVTVMFSVSKQYIAQANFSKAQATASSVEGFSQATLQAFDLYQDDRFVNTLAQIKITDINAMLSIESPTEIEQQLFLDTSQQALLLAGQAVQLDPTNPYNHAVLAGAYNTLAVAGIEGANERALAALEEAQKLDPMNPGYHLIAAQMALTRNNLSLAREEIYTALSLKRNFTQALYLLTQLEIIEGNTDSAISATQAIITLEPNNPSRYLQLGLLYSAKEDYQSAINTFARAIELDPLYANARYMQAVAYIETDQRNLALEQLLLVKETNPDNLLLLNLIEQIQSGSDVSIPDFGLNIPVSEQSPQVDAENTVTTDGEVDTDLITPVNTVSNTGEANETETDTTTENSSNETETQVVE